MEYSNTELIRLAKKNTLRYLRSIFDHAPLGIALVEDSGRPLLVNTRLCQILGFSEEELATMTLDQCTHPEDVDKDSDLYEQLTKNDIDQYAIEKRFISKAGKTCYLKLNLTRIEGQKDEIRHSLVMVEDISQQEKARQELKEANIKLATYNANLEQTVKDRTEQLEKVVTELEAFAYSISHDLRAPLRAIDGFSNALMEDYLNELPETAQHYLTRITSNSTRMGELIDSLLSFSRLSRSEMHFQSLDLGDRIASVLREINPPEHYQITTEGLGEIYGDRMLLEQLLQNLISNAIKYSSRESVPKIHIRQISHQNTDEVILSDNGAGFDMAYHDKLFEIFQRLHSEQEFEGTGIGLAICQKIVSRHQGKIWAESKIGDGATFYVSLPKRSQ